MLIELVIALLLGVLIGTFTGIFPGIHINLVGAFLVSISTSYLYAIPIIYLVTFISAMAIAHTFMDFIPSIFLGCPDADDSSLSVLPGHEMLREGEGYQAIMRTAYGGVYSVFLLGIFAFPLSFIVSKVYPAIQKIIPYILILVCITMILSERKKFQAFAVMALTGILGMCVLELNIKESLLPLLSGLFGSSMLLISINQNTKIPKQNLIFKKIGFKKLIKPISGALIASPLCGFLPGLGGGQAAVIGNQIAKTDGKGFLVLLGAVNVLVMGFSFVSLYSISKTRTGAAVAIQSLMGTMNTNILILILCVCLISGILSFFLVKNISPEFIKIIEKINYQKLSMGIISLLTILILFISGLIGFIVFVISTATGYYCIQLNVKKTQMMGCLLIPTIILYLI
jgi:putative membrane protein